jgi:hypothetical protein
MRDLSIVGTTEEGCKGGTEYDWKGPFIWLLHKFVYVSNYPTSQATLLQTSTDYYGDFFILGNPEHSYN